MAKPLFRDVASAYSTDRASVHSCSMTFPNTCAIRMSEALVAAEPKLLDRFRSSGYNTCEHGYMRGAQDLAAVLKRVWGAPTRGFEAPGSAPAALHNISGVICYMNIPTFRGQGHIDLWDKTGPVGSAYWGASPIWFWKLL